MRPTDIVPKVFLDELIRLANLDRGWVEYIDLPDNQYRASSKYSTWVTKTWTNGSSGFAMLGLSIWLVDGPKIFRINNEQCNALEQVQVNLTIQDYAQPYPAIAVELPKGKYAPFNSVLCHKIDKVLTCSLITSDHYNDITTTVSKPVDLPIEVALNRFDEDCKDHGPTAALALRVACNACLALARYGCHYDYLFPKEVESDKRLAKEKSERGDRARKRLPLAPLEVKFNQDVKLYDEIRGSHSHDEPTGKEIACHWRRGHFARMAVGKGRTNRRLIFRRPTLINSHLLQNNFSDITTIYSSPNFKKGKYDSPTQNIQSDRSNS